jgi:phenylalanyl-tRNA synthetase beta chain
MIISVNWLKKFTDIDMPIGDLATLIGARLVEIEEVIDFGAKYKDVVVARVVEAHPLEGSDHLNVTKLDDAGVTKDVERDENGYVQVVCGAPNVRTGIMVAWLPPKAIVPNTFADPEPFVLGARKLRGAMSNGMIASARELALFDEHEGILELDGDIQPGADFAKTYELDDYLLDIENKSLTHRPDCFGIVGFAREIAAIQGKQFRTPEWLMDIAPDFGTNSQTVETPKVTIDDATLSDRYQAVVLSGADGKKMSPLHIQTYLGRVGLRPISAIVDVTNYLMMLTGQPLHAFDYDKLVVVGGGTVDIHVRAARMEETLELLDGRMLQLTPDDIVITAGDTPISLAGAMGGASTEIDENTKTIIIESATFNLYKLRATQMRHGMFSEAMTRFTKGQPAELAGPVLAEAIRMMQKFVGTERTSDVAEAYPGKRNEHTITLETKKVNDILGSHFATDEVLATLSHVEFNVTVDDSEKAMRVVAPYWRADVHIDEDVVEEVGRLIGYDDIPALLPTRDFAAVQPAALDTLRANIRKALVRAGANEVLTYSFVHGDVLRKATQNPDESYRITNSISPDLQYYRQSITPSLLGLVHPNSKNGYDDFALFELNKVHRKTAEPLGIGEVPTEMHRVGFVITHKKALSGAPFYQAKRLLEYLASSLGLKLEYKPFVSDETFTFAKPFELKRSARIVDVTSNQTIGIVGEYKAVVARSFKLPTYTAGFELLTEGIALALEHKGPSYSPISRYPSTERDICFQVDENVSYQDIVQNAESALADIALETTIMPVDFYQSEDSATKNITIRIRFTSHFHTLVSEEISEAMEKVTSRVVGVTQARVV